jgi:hypothetical protein
MKTPEEWNPPEGGDMSGPGEYGADAAEGIVRVEDLPAPKVLHRCRSFKRRRCPECGHMAYRDKVFTRRLHDLGDLAANRPRELAVSYSQHCCSRCQSYFNVDLSDLAAPNSHYTRRVVALAVRLVVEDGLPYRAASWHLWRDHRVFVPFATLQNWVEAGGEKGRPTHHRRLSGRGAGQLLGLHRRR